MRLCAECGFKAATEWQCSLYDYWARALLDAWDATDDSQKAHVALASLRSLAQIAAHVDLFFPENFKRPGIVYHRLNWIEINKYGVTIEHPEIRRILISPML